MVQKGKPTVALDDRYGYFDAIWDEDIEKMQKLLRTKPTLLNAPEKNTGQTPLQWACAWGRSKAVDALLQKGADVNIRNKRGDQAFHIAGYSGNLKILYTLVVQGGANPTAIGRNNLTLLQWANKYGFRQTAKSLQHLLEGQTAGFFA